MKSELNKIQELELLSSLDSRAESPLKFAYLGDGYSQWISAAEKSRNESTVQHEEDLLKIESLPFIFRSVSEKTKTINLIDFGCGDGVPMLSIIKHLSQNGNYKINYIPVDISQEMLDAATRTILDFSKEIKVNPIVFDFEKGEVLDEVLTLTSDESTKNYFFLLGNTLGNFSNTEKILYNIKLSMFGDDTLILGNQISNQLASPKLIEYYKVESVFNLVTTTLREYGVDCNFNDYIVQWNAEQKQIEMLLKVPSKMAVKISDHEIVFEEGEQILLAVSKKFTEESLIDTFNNVGFRVDLFTVNKRKDVCLAALIPTRHRSS